MKTKIINVPIEPIEHRYSTQWDKWFLSQFANQEIDVHTIYGTTASGKITHGAFLDLFDTNMYKTEQAKHIIEVLKTFDDSYKLVLFFHDLWFPDILKIAYIRDGMGFKNLHICGCLHAGSYDEYDFLNKTGMTPWAAAFENSLFAAVDKIFVATAFHKKLVMEKREVPFSKIAITGFPIYMESFCKIREKENIVVFPHRLDSEKQPELFDKLEQRLKHTGWKFIKTVEACRTKEEYYELLGKAKIAVSFALQETWGIAMQEAVFSYAIPICPNRLSYQEMYLKAYKADGFEETVQLVEQFMKGDYSEILQNYQIYRLDAAGRGAISRIIKNMLDL